MHPPRVIRSADPDGTGWGRLGDMSAPIVRRRVPAHGPAAGPGRPEPRPGPVAAADPLTGRRVPAARSRSPPRWTRTAPRRCSRCATRRAGSARRPRRSTSARRSPEYGRRVLLVDFDPQGALSVGLGRPAARARHDDLQPDHGAADRPSTTSSGRPASRAWTCCPRTSTSPPPRSSWSPRSAASRPSGARLAPALDRLRLRARRLPALARAAHRQRPGLRATGC